jgi:hypothetical protein
MQGWQVVTEINGEWPDLPAEPPSLKELPINATSRDYASAYASAFLGFAPLWRKSVHALEFLYGRVMATSASLARIEKHLGIAPVAPPLPPMRDPEDSIHDFDAPLRHGRASLRAGVKEGFLSEADARKIAEDTVRRVNAATELSTWRKIKALGPIVGKEALKALATLVVGGAVVELLHLLKVIAH